MMSERERERSLEGKRQTKNLLLLRHFFLTQVTLNECTERVRTAYIVVLILLLLVVVVFSSESSPSMASK